MQPKEKPKHDVLFLMLFVVRSEGVSPVRQVSRGNHRLLRPGSVKEEFLGSEVLARRPRTTREKFCLGESAKKVQTAFLPLAAPRREEEEGAASELSPTLGRETLIFCGTLIFKVRETRSSS